MIQTGAEAIVKILQDEGIEYVFGLCGHGNVAVLDALYDSSIKFISVRNESSAVHMADAYYRTSGRIAAVLVTLGPGVTNTVTALADAVTDGAALVLIAADVPSYLVGKGALQELSVTSDGNQAELVRPVTKWSSRVPDIRLIPQFMYHALNIAQTGNPGPAVVSVPMNYFSETAEFTLDDPRRRRPNYSRPAADARGIAAAAQLVQASRKPMILAGNGVVLANAGPELLALAERLSIPVATSLVGQACYPKDHRLNIDCPNSVGNPAVSYAMRNADLVIVVGSRLSELEMSSWNTDYGFDPWSKEQRFVQIDLEPTEIGRNYPVEVGIVADAKLALAQLLEEVRLLDDDHADPSRRAEWVAQVLTLKTEWEAVKSEERQSEAVPISTQRLLGEIRTAAPKDAIFLVDTGGFGYAAGQHLVPDTPRSYYHNLGIGSMGPCMAAALGAKLANPSRKVVALVGDGGFTCEMSALVTAGEYGIGAVWVVLNNYSYNSIEAYQHKHYEHRILGTQFRDREGRPYNPDFTAVALACGLGASRVEKPSELAEAFKTAFSSDGPYVVEIMTGDTRFTKTYGFFEANRFFEEEARFKANRAVASAGQVK